MSKNMHTLFTAVMHVAEGLMFNAESRKFSYLPCRHMNTDSVQDGMAIFPLKTLITNKALR
jgi:hypothetical protein